MVSFSVVSSLEIFLGSSSSRERDSQSTKAMFGRSHGTGSCVVPPFEPSEKILGMDPFKNLSITSCFG